MPPISRPLLIRLPIEAEPYRDDIRRFLEAMVYKLGKNSHKGRWEKLNLEDILEKLEAERDELVESVARGNMVEILLEAADVANFALIIASMVVERGE
jgi:NTP pyrophosphatase (non-canonical NTP hydrolase)